MKFVSHSASFTIDAPVDLLFPLFSPEGEKKWVPGWDYINVMDSVELKEDYIFLTQNHDHSAADAIWIVKKYLPEQHLVAYYKIEPGQKAGLVTVKCTALENGKTNIRVSYSYQALSAEGENFIREFTSKVYTEFIAEWEVMLNRYLQQIPPVET